jgi:small subunit ribosomal protein S16
MSVKIRLTKTGKAHQISYRIVAQDTRSKRDGKFLEILGYYNPYNKPQLKIDNEKLNSWVQKGAKPTEAVSKLIEKSSQKPKTKKD